ncbi:50S ribosomal protein L33 [Pajaroellobacter abortibovis]|uniref:50S ribosomal protein L33 n=1 Tax=Pajaroellobacter abortibovis TaxID=1882918 RepID=UPI003B82E30D
MDGQLERGSSPKSCNNHPKGSSKNRVGVAFACTLCSQRNYKSTRKIAERIILQFKKFCPHCRSHTVHRETK